MFVFINLCPRARAHVCVCTCVYARVLSRLCVVPVVQISLYGAKTLFLQHLILLGGT